MAAPLLTLDQLISEACEQFAPADAPTRYYTAALSHAQAFRRELLAGSHRELKTVYLEVGDDYSADLPADYVEYTMLGLQLPGSAVTRNLIYNSRLSLLPPTFRAASPAGSFLDPLDSDECEQACYGLLDAGYDGYCGFGYPHFSQEFRIDRATGRVICNSLVPPLSLLALEYYGFGAKEGEDIALDPLAHSWGIHYVLERLNAQKKDWNAVAYHKEKVQEERAKYKNRTRAFSLDGALQAKHRAAAQRWK